MKNFRVGTHPYRKAMAPPRRPAPFSSFGEPDHIHWGRSLKFGTWGFLGTRKILRMVSSFSEHQKLQLLMMMLVTVMTVQLIAFLHVHWDRNLKFRTRGFLGARNIFSFSKSFSVQCSRPLLTTGTLIFIAELGGGGCRTFLKPF